ncbi:MAG: hypothetical protein ACOC3X_03355 [Nanoarchaeota archaeon]
MITKEKLITIILAISFLYLIFIVIIYNPEITSKIIAEGGKVSSLDIEYSKQEIYWYGIYGSLSEISKENYIQINNYYESLIEFNPNLIRCDNSKIYITTSNKIEWEKLQPAHPQDINNILNLDKNDKQSATNVYKLRENFKIINQTYLLYSAKTHSKEESFIQGLLKQNNDLVYVTKIKLNRIGFNGKIIDYQIMIPKPKNKDTKYYFFLDPIDLKRCNETIAEKEDTPGKIIRDEDEIEDTTPHIDTPDEIPISAKLKIFHHKEDWNKLTFLVLIFILIILLTYNIYEKTNKKNN